MYSVRRYVVRHSRLFEWAYDCFEPLLVFLDPLWSKVGYNRIERPVVIAERAIKGFLFDCQMCGQCVLSSTGMSCPMNCPKNLRNGPCGGVRENGHCEVKPDEMRLGRRLGRRIAHARRRQDHHRAAAGRPLLEGSSSWLRVARERAEENARAVMPPARPWRRLSPRHAKRSLPQRHLADEPPNAQPMQEADESTTVMTGGEEPDPWRRMRFSIPSTRSSSMHAA